MATHSKGLAWKIPWTEEPWWAADHGVAKGLQRGRKGVAKSWIQLSNWAYTYTQNVNNSNFILFIPSLTAICCLCKIKI